MLRCPRCTLRQHTPRRTYGMLSQRGRKLHDAVELVAWCGVTCVQGADAVAAARRKLQPLVDEVGRLLLSQGPRLRLASAPGPLTREAGSLANPLGLHTGVPLLVVPEVPFLGRHPWGSC